MTAIGYYDSPLATTRTSSARLQDFTGYLYIVCAGSKRLCTAYVFTESERERMLAAVP